MRKVFPSRSTCHSTTKAALHMAWRPDPTPDKGRALGRLEERKGRKIEKRRAAD